MSYREDTGFAEKAMLSFAGVAVLLTAVPKLYELDIAARELSAEEAARTFKITGVDSKKHTLHAENANKVTYEIKITNGTDMSTIPVGSILHLGPIPTGANSLKLPAGSEIKTKVINITGVEPTPQIIEQPPSATFSSPTEEMLQKGGSAQPALEINGKGKSQ